MNDHYGKKWYKDGVFCATFITFCMYIESETVIIFIRDGCNFAVDMLILVHIFV